MQIYELVAKTPKISASELANALKAELKDVSSALRLLVDVGDLAKSTRFGEQGRQCQVYELTDEFRRSRAGKDLLVGIGNEVVDAPAPAAPAAPATANAAPAAPAATGSKVDRAIACIAKLDFATDDQVRAAMGLTPRDSPSSYLASARKSGRVVRDGDRWRLGTGQPQRPAPQPEAKPNDVAAVTELRKPEPAPAAAAPPTPREREYSCAVWLSGNIEIRKAGGRVVITHQELLEITAFAAERRVA